MSAVVPASSSGLIARAEHAIRTNQPNLAITYLTAADAAKRAERHAFVAEVRLLRIRKAAVDARTRGNQIANMFFNAAAVVSEAERSIRECAKQLAPLYTQGSAA